MIDRCGGRRRRRCGDAAAGTASAGSCVRIARSSSCSRGPGSRPSSSARERRASRSTSSASTCRPDRYSARARCARSGSRSGMLGDEGAQLSHELRVATAGEVRLDPPLQRVQPHLVEPQRLGHEQAALRRSRRARARARARAPRRRPPTPPGAGPSRERVGAGRRALLEAVDVAAAALDVEHVGVAPRLDRVAPERPAQIRDVALDDVARRRRRGIAPHLVDQAPDRDRPVRADHEHGEHGAATRAADGDDTVAVEHLQRTENPVVVHARRQAYPGTSGAQNGRPAGRAVRSSAARSGSAAGPAAAGRARVRGGERAVLGGLAGLGRLVLDGALVRRDDAGVGRRVLHEDDAARPCGSRRCRRSPGARSCRAAVRPSPGRRMPST